jgi:hypothetical protein
MEEGVFLSGANNYLEYLHWSSLRESDPSKSVSAKKNGNLTIFLAGELGEVCE